MDSPAPADVTSIGQDHAALDAFYREHVEAVQRFVSRRVTSPHDAADLTADVFVAAIEAAAGYRASASPVRAWLFGIARNVVAMHHRSTSRDSRAVQRIAGRALLDDDAVARAVDRIDGERSARLVLESLQALPEGQRAVVELVAVDGLSLAEAAAALGIQPSAARVRYHRARRHLLVSLPALFPQEQS